MNESRRDDRGQYLDLPIGRLVSLHERKPGQKHRRRLAASVRALGLIEPLVVFPKGDDYAIVDGCLRYRILLEMGVETVPCRLWNGPTSFHLDA